MLTILVLPVATAALEGTVAMYIMTMMSVGGNRPAVILLIIAVLCLRIPAQFSVKIPDHSDEVNDDDGDDCPGDVCNDQEVYFKCVFYLDSGPLRNSRE